MTVPEITVEQAYAVLNAHYASKDAERAAKSRELVGRCFKMDGPDIFLEEKVWRCAKITGVGPTGHAIGLSVQVRLRSGVVYECDAITRNPMQGWIEIGTGEMRRFAAIIPASELGELVR